MRIGLGLLLLLSACAVPAPAESPLPDASFDASVDTALALGPVTCRTGQLNLRLVPQPGGCGETLPVTFSVNIIEAAPSPGWAVSQEVASVEGTVQGLEQCRVDLYRVLPETTSASASLVHAWVTLDPEGGLVAGGATFRRVFTPNAGCLQPLTIDELHW